DFDKLIGNEPIAGLTDAVFNQANGTACSFANPLSARFSFNVNATTGTVDCLAANIARVDIHVVNGAKVKTDGLDMALQYDFDNVLGGSAAVGVNATYIFKYDVGAQMIDGIVVAPATDAVGKLNYQTASFPLPQWKGNLFAEYTHGPHNIRYVMNYVD